MNEEIIDTITDEIFDSVIDIRDSGVCNMLNITQVQREAYDRGHYKLVTFIEEHRGKYFNFILTGER